MKKTISIFLVVCLLFLSGCSALFAPKPGLSEIAGMSEYATYISCADLGEKYWVLLTCEYVPGDAPEQTTAETNAQGESAEDAYASYAAEDREYYYSLSLVEPRRAKVLHSVSLKDCPIEDPIGVKYTEDGNILVYNDYTKESVLYSDSLDRLSEKQAYTPVDLEKTAKQNPVVNDAFSRYDTFAHDWNDFYGLDRVQCYAFYDETDAVYFAPKANISPFCGDGKRVLGTVIEDTSDMTTQTLRVYDFAASTMVNEIVTPDYGSKKAVSLNYAALRADSAFLCIGEGSDGEEGDYNYHYYLWNYTADAKNTSFECERYTEAQIEAENEKLCAAMHSDYGVEVLINEANQSTIDKDEVYSLILGAKPYQVYSTLVGIRCFFDSLPQNFVRETYTGMEHIETRGLRIYIAKGVTGFPNAYANAWGEYFEIALSAESFGLDTFSHEFMHIIDERLEDYYWEENLNDVWSNANPEGFEYMGYEDLDSEDWDDAVCEKYNDDFASRYAMSAATEDRADTFASLYSCGINKDNNEPPYWYIQGTAAAQKAVLLCGMIRSAFPCMNGAPLQAWEKSIAQDLQAKG